MSRRIIGRSVEKRAILSYEISMGRRVRSEEICVVVFGGFHGDEPKSVRLVETLRDELSHRLPQLPKPTCWILVPSVNPDGLERRTRRNARKVDLNRNFPTQNWEPGNARSRMYGGPVPASEPETRAVIRLLEKHRPDAIVTVHSIDRHRFCNNYDGPGRELARRMSRCNRYPVTASIGYPTPGSFGNWAGAERRIPTITLELPTHHSFRQIWIANRIALLQLGAW